MKRTIQWRPISGKERALCAGLAFMLLAPLAVGAFLAPDVRGHGTHEQLGLPPCAAMQLLGIPCMFCGMTTSVTWFVHGHPMQSFLVQPAAAALVVCGTAVAGGLGCVAVLGRVPEGWQRWRGPGMRVAVLVLVVSWVYKMVTVIVE